MEEAGEINFSPSIDIQKKQSNNAENINTYFTRIKDFVSNKKQRTNSLVMDDSTSNNSKPKNYLSLESDQEIEVSTNFEQDESLYSKFKNYFFKRKQYTSTQLPNNSSTIPHSNDHDLNNGNRVSCSKDHSNVFDNKLITESQALELDKSKDMPNEQIVGNGIYNEQEHRNDITNYTYNPNFSVLQTNGKERNYHIPTPLSNESQIQNENEIRTNNNALEKNSKYNSGSPSSTLRSNISNVGNLSRIDYNNLYTSPTHTKSFEELRHISTASLRKKLTKTQHCKYCNRSKDKKELETHLRKTPYCASLYMREYKVNCITAVLISCFPCLNCTSIAFTNLKQHLDSRPECLLYYTEKFNVRGSINVMKIVRNLRRQKHNSRQQLNRQLCRIQIVEKETKTMTEAINDFKQSTALANYRLCCLCLGNYLGY